MAAVNDVLAIGDDISPSFTPTENVSDVVIEGNGGGMIALQCLVPSSSNWVTVSTQTGAFSISTADVAILYRFKGSGLQSAVRCYIGP